MLPGVASVRRRVAPSLLKLFPGRLGAIHLPAVYIPAVYLPAANIPAFFVPGHLQPRRRRSRTPPRNSAAHLRPCREVSGPGGAHGGSGPGACDVVQRHRGQVRRPKRDNLPRFGILVLDQRRAATRRRIDVFAAPPARKSTVPQTFWVSVCLLPPSVHDLSLSVAGSAS